MAAIRNLLSMVFLLFLICSAGVNIEAKDEAKRLETKNGEKRLDIHGSYCILYFSQSDS